MSYTHAESRVHLGCTLEVKLQNLWCNMNIKLQNLRGIQKGELQNLVCTQLDQPTAKTDKLFSCTMFSQTLQRQDGVKPES